MAISVLMPYRDAGRTIDDAVASTLGDLAPGDELVAIDDGSRDDGPDRMASWASRDPRVVLLGRGAEPRGTGIATALARGLAAARHPLIGRMDADDVVVRGRFAAQRAALESAPPRVAVVATRIALVPVETPGMTAYVAWQNGLLSPEDHALAVHVESPVCHPAVLARRSALEAVGGFRDAPWPEDWDLWLRLHHAGFALAKVPFVGLHWRRHAETTTTRDPRCAPDRMRAARASYLAPELLARPFAVWGAGQTGRRLARALAERGARPAFFVDIDPRKVGRVAQGAPIVGAEDGIRSAQRDEVRLVVAVGERGARDVVRARLVAAGLVEGPSFVCAA